MLEEPRLRISVTKGCARDKRGSAFQNSLRTLAIVMTGNHSRRSTHPLPLLKTLCLLGKKRRETGKLACMSVALPPLKLTFTQAVQFEIPQTPGRCRAGSTVPILQGEKFGVREGNEPRSLPGGLSLKPTTWPCTQLRRALLVVHLHKTARSDPLSDVGVRWVTGILQDLGVSPGRIFLVFTPILQCPHPTPFQTECFWAFGCPRAFSSPGSPFMLDFVPKALLLASPLSLPGCRTSQTHASVIHTGPQRPPAAEMPVPCSRCLSSPGWQTCVVLTSRFTRHLHFPPRISGPLTLPLSLACFSIASLLSVSSETTSICLETHPKIMEPLWGQAHHSTVVSQATRTKYQKNPNDQAQWKKGS